MATFTATKFMGTVSLSGPTWGEEFPIDELPGQIEFYDGMVARYHKKTDTYSQIVAALRSLLS